ncbi:MAG TPA: hypothetical protein VGM36_09545, partial [Rhizomicrobium sp.]
MSQTESPEPRKRARGGVHPFRALKRLLPRGLFWRSLIIIVAPVVLLQGLMSYFFFERHLEITTERMAADVAADVAFLINLEDTSPAADRPILRGKAQRMLRYTITFFPGDKIGAPAPADKSRSTIEDALETVIAQQIGETRHYDVDRMGDLVDIRVEVHDGVL